MSVWKVAGVDVVPGITLSSWQIMRVLAGDYARTLGDHFVGWNERDREGRVSTRITAFDPVSGVGITESGRSYRLIGGPGWNLDAEYVWKVWAEHCGVSEQCNVTDEYVAKLAAAAADQSQS